MSGTKVIYGYKDLDHAIMCTVKDLIFRGMDILIVADCEGGTITAPVEMFQWMEAQGCIKYTRYGAERN